MNMSTQNWIIAAVVVLLIIAGFYFVMRPTGETPAGTTAPPATTEQPAQPAPANQIGRPLPTGSGAARLQALAAAPTSIFRRHRSSRALRNWTAHSRVSRQRCSGNPPARISRQGSSSIREAMTFPISSRDPA